MFYISSWLNPRKKQLLSITLDYLIYIFIFIKSPFPQYFSFVIINIWLIYCYVHGKYFFKNTKLIFIIKNQVFSFFLSIFFLFIIKQTLLFFFSNALTGNSIELFVNKFFQVTYLSLILNLIIGLWNKSFNNNNEKWGFIGSNDKLQILLDDLHACKDKIQIKYCSEEVLQENINNFCGFIIDPAYSDSLNLKKTIKKHNKEYYSLDDWLTNYINRCPVLLISEEFIYKKIIKRNSSSIQYKIKRLSEIIFSIILILLLLPIIGFAILLVFLEDRHNPLYFQERTGIRNESFKITKIRTMKKNAENNTPVWAKKNDERITKIGALIRKFRIDELPQLVAVINGKMSLIGPRPERPEIDDKLYKQIKNYGYRYQIRPGLSGWAQVNYPYGSSVKDSYNKLSYDLFYISNYSIFIDILILFKTIRLVFNGIGYKPND